MTFARHLLLLSLLLSVSPLTAYSRTIESGKSEVQLIELYTSEGCSSCPPAESWFTELVTHPRLWKDFVPIAFHVDYWNGLGWPDGFSKPEYSDRQRTYQVQGNIATVYTPGFVIQGDEWRGWFQNSSRPKNTRRDVGKLSIFLTDSRAQIQFDPEINISKGVLHFAWLGFGFQCPIQRGENAGKTLQENFVVLKHQHQSAVNNADKLYAEFDLLKPNVNPSQRLAVVAWVSSEDNQRPLQAVGSWYPADPDRHTLISQ